MRKIKDTEMDRGRPSRFTQAQIREKLRSYYEYGISATIAAKRIGVNVKTACRYFDEWSKQDTMQQNSDHIEQQKIKREQIITSYDTQLVKAIDALEDVQSTIDKIKKDGKQIPDSLFTQRLNTMKFINTLIKERGSFELHLPMDQKIKETIQEAIMDVIRQSN